VIAIGPEVGHVEVGDRVMFAKFARSTDVTIDGVDYLVMEVSEILGVMK
jgi:co-chaperonin GroES (HSP10)